MISFVFLGFFTRRFTIPYAHINVQPNWVLMNYVTAQFPIDRIHKHAHWSHPHNGEIILGSPIPGKQHCISISNVFWMLMFNVSTTLFGGTYDVNSLSCSLRVPPPCCQQPQTENASQETLRKSGSCFLPCSFPRIDDPRMDSPLWGFLIYSVITIESTPIAWAWRASPQCILKGG